MNRSRAHTARPQHRQLLTWGGALLAGLVLSGGPVRADQPNRQNALSQLQAAKASLQAASHNKGGQRVNAIRLIDQAIVAVQLGIDAAR